MTEPEKTRFVREFWYRDENDRQRFIRIETTDAAELARVAKGYASITGESRVLRKRWRKHLTTFTGAEIKAGDVSESIRSCDRPNPWDADDAHYFFAHLLGQDETWDGPESLWVTTDLGKTWVCRFCGHRASLTPTECCLNPDCCRTGQDCNIPAPSASDLARRRPPDPPVTKLPEPVLDATGKVLKGGLG